nr:antistasin isoform X1 [Biomphalaria glabrata]
MKILLCTVLLVAVVSAAVDILKKRQFGLCVEMCTPGTADSGCSPGHICIGNGCGHVCQILLPGKRACPGVTCDMLCLHGQKIGADGCPLCECENPWH